MTTKYDRPHRTQAAVAIRDSPGIVIVDNPAVQAPDLSGGRALLLRVYAMRLDKSGLPDTADIVGFPAPMSAGRIRTEGVRFARGAVFGVGMALALWAIALATLLLSHGLTGLS